MKPKTLSVVLATRNEEAFLEDCLKSIKDIADEIIIFDENSSDKTREIAKKYKARVFLTKHEPIFHITKNKAIKKAKGDWVLQLDADERNTLKLNDSIKKVLNGDSFGYDGWLSPLKVKINKLLPIFKAPNTLSKPAAAYWIPRRNNFLGRYLLNSGQYPDPAIRFFQNGKAILPAKDVHEFMKVDGQIGWLHDDMLHESSPNFSRYLKRENYYSSLEAQLFFERGKKINLINTISYLFIKPLFTFFEIFIRRRGFMDGFPGFVFSLYSGFHHALSYMKLWEIYKNHGKN